MTYATFGHQRIKDELPSPVDTMLNKLPKGSLSSTEAQLVLREEYETLYGIHNHDAIDNLKTRPLSIVARHHKERYAAYSRLHQTVRRYRIHDIGEKFKLSLNDFLELPREMVELLFEISAEEAMKQQPTIDKAMRDLEKGR